MTPDYIDPAIGWPLAAGLFIYWLASSLVRARRAARKERS